MMMCSKCGKRPAVVFMTGLNGTEKFEKGYCLACAKEIGVPQVNEYLKQMGITDEDLENGFDMLFGGQMPEGLGMGEGEMPDMEDLLIDDDDDSVDGFKKGGANTLPQFMEKLFGSKSSENSNADETKSEKKEKKKKSKEAKKRKFLETFCTNLTGRAKDGKMDRIIGRDKEIERVIQILSRRTKNNPCLIGEPGVGKTAIAEGIAQKIVAGDVPFRLQDKELYLLDLTALVAGTQFRGQFESRVKSLIDEIKEAGNIILFIDEVHNLVGTGDSEGTMNAANMFKPALSRGELQVIGATTFNEYRKHIEKDSALERRFQPVTVLEPTVDETAELLRGIKNYYEEHHKIKVAETLIRPCVTLSERYITDRFLPDKAIDLLDEACACASIRSAELTEYERLTKSNKALEVKETELMSDTESIDYEKLAEIKTERAKNDAKLKELAPLVENVELTASDLSTVIEMWTGIPAKKIMETEFKKIAKLETILKEKIIGQDEACETVAAAVKRTRVQLSTKRRPASFIFVGPTGVGKTQLVKVLSEELFSGVEPLIRLDMSEYMEKHSVSKIIGSPPGYVGFDDAGQLTEKVRRRPYSVILFDEIEKAHPDVMNILLQILDEGKVNDSHGRAVNFENTIICMTSNAGSTDSSGLGFGKTTGDISKEKAMKALQAFLRPEFLGRVDEVIVFSPLSVENYADIAKLMMKEMIEALSENGIKLTVSDEAYKWIAEKSHGGKYGGRDIRKVIRKDIEDKVANLIVGAEIPPEKISIKVNKAGELVVK